jgi:predicted neutral ceramidase superfamily lipid hydrolase
MGLTSKQKRINGVDKRDWAEITEEVEQRTITNTESIRSIKNDIETIKTNHLAHLEKDVCAMHKKVDAMDKRLWYILMLLVASTVIGMLGEKIFNAL